MSAAQHGPASRDLRRAADWAGTQGSKGQVLNPLIANASRWLNVCDWFYWYVLCCSRFRRQLTQTVRRSRFDGTT